MTEAFDRTGSGSGGLRTVGEDDSRLKTARPPLRWKSLSIVRGCVARDCLAYPQTFITVICN